MKILWILLFILLSSCSHHSARVSLNSIPKSASEHINEYRAQLFPLGLYIHRITMKDPKGKKREFKGVLLLGEKTIQLTGLAAFDTTFFKLSEDLDSGKISYKFYHEVPKAFEEKLILFYSFMKSIFKLPSKAPYSENTLTQIKEGNLEYYKDPSSGFEINFSRYTANKIPGLMEVKKDNFKITIVLEKYQVSTQDKE